MKAEPISQVDEHQQATALDSLLSREDLWRGQQWQQQSDCLSSGYTSLDEVLAGQGWPSSGVCELLSDQVGIGELTLLLPLIAQHIPLSGTADKQRNGAVALVAPPFIPFAAGLAQHNIDVERIVWVDCIDRKEQLWALEQALASGVCQLALIWLSTLSVTESRRLQLACEKGHSLCFCYLPSHLASQSHPVQLRIQLHRDYNKTVDNAATELTIVKRRGGWPIAGFELSLLPRYLAYSDWQKSPSKPEHSVSSDIIQGPWSS
ncbi:translesion DNA synthesis-associated protein ImuA [Shewanella waksmanii]|uniref:translesion DNA synthesis-associated protein ImuA n=1 Tax=Shewanella waksmanii TaxID=213783 RepID=UPI0004B5C46D|nr:translesion DNA synthesis-associated protein ImuA [Shewanella waksmanii]